MGGIEPLIGLLVIGLIVITAYAIARAVARRIGRK